AIIAALQAAAFRFATFKSKPKRREPLARIDIAAKKIPGLDETVAAAAGNNLARWLTALPPNTLDARGYRRILEELARRLHLGFKFYGEKELGRRGARCRHRAPDLPPTRRPLTRHHGAGIEPRGQGHLFRHRRHQSQAAQK